MRCLFAWGIGKARRQRCGSCPATGAGGLPLTAGCVIARVFGTEFTGRYHIICFVRLYTQLATAASTDALGLWRDRSRGSRRHYFLDEVTSIWRIALARVGFHNGVARGYTLGEVCNGEIGGSALHWSAHGTLPTNIVSNEITNTYASKQRDRNRQYDVPVCKRFHIP